MFKGGILCSRMSLHPQCYYLHLIIASSTVMYFFELTLRLGMEEARQAME
jgi:hypothetical protein